MKLEKFSIKRYRNIESADFTFGNYTVLLGPNNQGKTTVLRGLELALNTCQEANSRVSYAHKIGPSYSFDDDYPKGREYRSSRQTEFVLAFVLNEEERARFYKETRLHNNGNIKIRVSFPRDERTNRSFPSFFILEKRGKGGKNYRTKAKDVAQFIGVSFHRAFIPVIRTEEEAKAALQNLVSMNLQPLSRNQEYLDCLGKMRKMEREAVNAANDSIKEALADFLPGVRGVRISYDPPVDSLRISRDYFDIYIDDAVDTALQTKGSGVSSLAVIALIQNNVSKDALIVIEEPECHLHADAIHSVASRLKSASSDNQIIISTHNPAFVQTAHLDQTYCVENGVWRHPKSLYDLRHSLGLTNTDSLFWPEKVIIVEGDDDRLALSHMIRWLSPNRLVPLLDRNDLLVASCGGASLIPQIAAYYANSLVNFMAVCDGDQSGKAAATKTNGLSGANRGAITINPVLGKNEAELEDILPASVVCDVLGKRGIPCREQELLNHHRRFNLFLRYKADACGMSLEKKDELAIKDEIAISFSRTLLKDDLFEPSQLSEWKRIVNQIEEAFEVS